VCVSRFDEFCGFEGVVGSVATRGTDRKPVSAEAMFEEFVRTCGADLRRALSARYGVEVGVEVTADVLAYAWERWTRISAMENPVGYLFRVGQSAARRYRRRSVALPLVHTAGEPEFDPRLSRLLEELPDRQRMAVVLVCVYDWTYPKCAGVLGVSESTARTHVRRGLDALRRELGDIE
jgi:DNA-directed RNA polymerase specialized sigma24 family protein